MFHDILSDSADEFIRLSSAIFFPPTIVAATQVGEQLIAQRYAEEYWQAFGAFFARWRNCSIILLAIEIQGKRKTLIIRHACSF